MQEYPKLLTRFVEEARLLARLDHPNIVVLGAFEALGTAYYVMPWLGGNELHKAAPATVTEEWLQPILRTMLGALKYLHANNIYHRDVKPANILLTEEGTPVLIDFGTARQIISERSATLVGSPGYSPVEQLRTHGKRGPWTDIYSLGATCYRLITGENPPEAFDRLDEDEDPLHPLAHRAELFGRFTPEFLATIDKALAIQGKDRWQSTEEWLAALSESEAETAILPKAPIVDISPINITSEQPHSAPKQSPILFSIWIIISTFLFITWIGAAGATLVLILLVIFYTLFPLIWLLRLQDKRKAILFTGRNLALLYILMVLLSFTDVMRVTAREAARSGQTATLRLCLYLPGIDVNKADEHDSTPLNEAASKGHTKCVKLLLAAPGIDVNKADKDGWTPLNRAAYEGHTECVKLLLAAPGIDVNKTDYWTPLHWAAFCNHTECVRLLLAAPGIDVNKADKYDGITPLGRASGECAELIRAAGGR